MGHEELGHAAPPRRLTSLLCSALALFAFACSDSGDAKKVTTEEPVTGEWETLLTGDWTMAPGTEDYVCVRYTLEEDVYVRGLEAVNPLGTHHTFLASGEPSKPDGTAPCTVAEVHSNAIFGSGVGTAPIEFPKGVGMKIPAGRQLLLNLHLYNNQDSEISGTSGTRVLRVDKSDLEYIGDEVPAVNLDLDIPPGKETTIESSYTATAEMTLFAILPHMHKLGTHSKVTVESSIEGERVIHDAPYDFDLQLYYPVEPIRLAKGDKVRFDCTWMNTTSRTIHFGDSSDDEMCAIGLYRYPGK
jgi:hypothetical protein